MWPRRNASRKVSDFPKRKRQQHSGCLGNESYRTPISVTRDELWRVPFLGDGSLALAPTSPMSLDFVIQRPPTPLLHPTSAKPPRAGQCNRAIAACLHLFKTRGQIVQDFGGRQTAALGLGLDDHREPGGEGRAECVAMADDLPSLELRRARTDLVDAAATADGLEACACPIHDGGVVGAVAAGCRCPAQHPVHPKETSAIEVRGGRMTFA